MKMTVFWDVAPCNLVEVYQRLEVIAASIIRAMSYRPDKGSKQSETSVNFY
jgi:hypothetical protein